VRIDHDLISDSGLDHLEAVLHLPLAVVVFHARFARLVCAIVIGGDDPACIRDMAGLYRMHAERLGKTSSHPPAALRSWRYGRRFRCGRSAGPFLLAAYAVTPSVKLDSCP
jgi:hypothetical protein